MAESPITILTAIAAPALLTNACSVLSLGTVHRMGRVVDRTRFITAAMLSAETASIEYASYVQQLEGLAARRELLLKALRGVYASLGAFAGSALIAICGAGLASMDFAAAFRASEILGLGVGTFGVASLTHGCSLMIRETRLAILSLAEEAEFMQKQRRARGE